jgi:hypothetical protein
MTMSDRPLHLTVEIFPTMRLRDVYALPRQTAAYGSRDGVVLRYWWVLGPAG